MKRLQKYIVIFGTAMLCVGFSACSKQSDFDAQAYVKSSLDAEYHGTYAAYANLMEISEEDAKKQVEEDFNESICQQFASSDNITEEEIAAELRRSQQGKDCTGNEKNRSGCICICFNGKRAEEH